MAKRCNHYDVAFERLLQLIRRPYVSVNETRRAPFRDETLKSMDFIVYSQQTDNLLIDVKGRRQFAGSATWKNWTTADDVASLIQWESVFGAGFRALFVFAYELSAGGFDRHSLIWDLKGRRYAFYGVWARDYAQWMNLCSPSWKTVSLRAKDFARIRHPLLEIL